MGRDRSSLWWLVAGVALLAAGVALWTSGQTSRSAGQRQPQGASDSRIDDLLLRHVETVIEDLIQSEVRAQRDAVEPALSPDVPRAGSLAAARRWLSRDLPTLLWRRVGTDLALTPSEMERAWRNRARGASLSVSYGTGTFIAIRLVEPHDEDEVWWARASMTERSEWLRACFVETSGVFDIESTSVFLLETPVERRPVKSLQYR